MVGVLRGVRRALRSVAQIRSIAGMGTTIGTFAGLPGAITALRQLAAYMCRLRSPAPSSPSNLDVVRDEQQTRVEPGRAAASARRAISKALD